MALDANVPNQAALPIMFVVVGGGIAGLACAIALRRVGHHVVVLEKSPSEERKSSGGCRLPPNLSKIFYHWGLESQLKPISFQSQAVTFQTFEEGDFLGQHIWDEEMLRETRGEFVFAKHADLWAILYQAAVACGADVRLGAEVVSVDPTTASATLRSGEIVQGTVVVGADGVLGVTRRLMIDEDEDALKPRSTMNLYSTTIPATEVRKHEALSSIENTPVKSLSIWFGNGRSAMLFPTGDQSDFALYSYCPKDGHEGTWDRLLPPSCLGPIFESSESRLQLLASLAGDVTCVPVVEHPELEDWVHDSGKLVLIGEAAHPLPPGAIQESAMTIEDGAVLAKLFSHLHSEDQIKLFLDAFQDLRQPRCNHVVRKELADIHYMTIPKGEFQETRNSMMKAKHAAGLNVLAGTDDMDESPEWAEIMHVFAYDAEDEADNWWVQWGVLRDRAKGVRLGFEKNIFVGQSEIDTFA